MTGIAAAAQQIEHFAACVFAADDVIEIRRLPSGRSTWHRADTLGGLADALTRENANGQNMHLGINPRRVVGGTKADDVLLARCVFVDFDQTDVAGAMIRIEDANLPSPTLIVNSGHGVHCYWRLAEPIVALELWTRMQRGLAAACGSDPAVSDPPRLMRLPGFQNLKAPRADCLIVIAEAERVYPLAEFERFAQAMQSKTSGPAASVEGAIPSGRRNATLISLGGSMRRRGMSDDAILAALRAENARCEPPLDAAEVRGIVHSVVKYEPAPPDTLPDDPGPGWATLGQITRLPQYRAGIPPLSTTYAALDDVLRGGFRPECSYVIAGRTGSAKSSLVLNIARRMALGGESVLLFKLEESAIESAYRIHAAASQVDLNTLLDGPAAAKEAREKLISGWELIRDIPLRIATCRRIESICRTAELHVADGGRLIILDQLSHVDCGTEIGYQQATAASNRIRLLARDLRVPIIVVCQVNRAAARNEKDKLTCNDLRDSGAIENDAAAVLLIDQAVEPPGPIYGGELVRDLEIIVGKNRYGPCRFDNPLILRWWPRTGRIEDAARVFGGAA